MMYPANPTRSPATIYSIISIFRDYTIILCKLQGYFSASILPNRSGESLFGFPSFTQTCTQSFRRNSYFFCPFNKTLCFPHVSKITISSCISALFKISRPTTIFFAIVTVYINAVNRGVLLSKIFYVLLIRLVHLIFELFKTGPFIFNSPAAVKVIPYVFLIFASFFYTHINSIKSSLSHSVSLMGFGTNVEFQTTARFCILGAEIIRNTSYFISAGTNTFPPMTACFITSGIIYYRESSKPLSSYIFKQSVSWLHTINAVRSSAQRLLLPARTSNNPYYTSVVKFNQI